MNYTQFERYLLDLEYAESFVSQCLRRIQETERAFGNTVETLVHDVVTMEQSLRDLEWKISKNDLDNYQNSLRHYYKMVHGEDFPGRAFGNRRLK